MALFYNLRQLREPFRPFVTSRLNSYGKGISTWSHQDRSAFAYCIDQVRKFDYENYVWTVQLPKHLRAALFAIRAFNVESALIADQVKSKESPLVQIRFQWWRDAIDGAFRKDGSAKHPVTAALEAVLLSQPAQQTQGNSQTAPSLKKYHFKRILDTREQDILDPQPPLTVEGLEKYAEGTAAQVLYLQLASVGAVSREADHAASHLGKAVGITTLLKGTLVHAQQRRSYLPIDLCAQHGVSQEDIYSGNVTEGLRDVALKVASVAKAHLDEARALQPRLSPQARQLMLPALAAADYLTALEATNFNLFEPHLLKGGSLPLSHVLKLKWHLMRGTY